MNSGNSSKISKIDDNPIVDIRMNSSNKNIIRANSCIDGNSTLGDNSGNSGNSSSTVNDPVVKRNTKSDNKSGCHNKKFDLRIDSSDKNVIGPNSRIDGNSIIGDNSGNSGKIDDNPVLGNSNNTKSNNNDGGYDILNNLLKAGFKFDNNEVNYRFNSSDKNIIGAYCEIQGDSIVGDGSGNTKEHHERVRRREQEQPEQQQKKAAATTNTAAATTNTTATTEEGGGNDSNNKVGAK